MRGRMLSLYTLIATRPETGSCRAISTGCILGPMSGDIEVYKKQGLGKRMGFGERPALLLIDFINGFNDPALLGGGVQRVDV